MPKARHERRPKLAAQGGFYCSEEVDVRPSAWHKPRVINVKRMRALDAVLGNAACSFFALLKNVGLSRAPREGVVRHVVVMKFFGLGSIVVASPALRALRKEYPDATLHFVSFQSNKGVLELLGQCDEHHYIDPSNLVSFARSTLSVAHTLWKADCDLMVDLEFFAKFPLVLGALAGIRRKAGFYLTAESWRRGLLDVHGWYNHYFHVKDIYLSLVYQLSHDDAYYVGFDAWRAEFEYPVIDAGAEAQAAVQQILDARGIRAGTPLVLLNANTSPDLAPEARKWPLERYAELADRLAAEVPGCTVALVGAKSESSYVDEIVGYAKSEKVMSLAGAFNLRELLALFERSALFVSNDSGPMHLACLGRVPTVGLFFADSPTLFAPLGAKKSYVAPSLYSLPLFTVYNGKDVLIGKPTDEIKNTLARAVSVDEVMNKVREVLA